MVSLMLTVGLVYAIPACLFAGLAYLLFTLKRLPDRWRGLWTLHPTPWTYWWIGTALVTLALPLGAVDMMVNLEWFFPNPLCDSLGILLHGMAGFLLNWGLGAAASIAVLTFLAQLGGPLASPRPSILQPWLGPWWRNIVVSLLAMALAAFPLYIFGDYLLALAVPRTIGNDCRGNASYVSITQRGPLLMVLPWLSAAFCIWILHLRALALAPRQTKPDPKPEPN